MRVPWKKPLKSNLGGKKRWFHSSPFLRLLIVAHFTDFCLGSLSASPLQSRDAQVAVIASPKALGKRVVFDLQLRYLSREGKLNR